MENSLINCRIEDEIALLTLANPPVNALGLALRQALEQQIRAIAENDSIRAVVLTGAGKVFVGGADVSEFDRPAEAPHLPDLIGAIAQSRKPWIAALNGAALGGGAELALGCHYRIFTPGAVLALPETRLGILPGAGGTQRLPRLIGVKRAAEVILGLQQIAAQEAFRIGLADQIAEADLTEASLTFARTILEKPLPVSAGARPLADPGTEFWAAQEAKLAKSARGNPGPMAALEAMRLGVTGGFSAGIRFERERFLDLRQRDEAAALRYAFFAERAAPRPPALRGIAPRPFALIGVIGGGTMGSGITAALLNAGLSVTLAETSAGALENGLARVRAILAAQVTRGLHDQAEADRRLARLEGTIMLESLAPCDMVIEAVFEDLAVKRDVFTRLTAICRADAILATNTSYLNPEEIIIGLPHPGRCIALHFFSPAQVMKLLEIVPLEATTPETLATGFALAARLGKIPVQAGNCEGFIGNRILKRYRAAAEELVLQGNSPGAIDQAMRDYGLNMGPFEMQDMAGLDIAFRAREAARAAEEDLPETAGDILVRAGRLGQKAGAGWYDYAPESRKPIPSERVAALLAPLLHDPQPRDSQAISARLIGVMAEEGQAILAAGAAKSASDIDLVKLHGYGFPRHKGGPMFARARAGQKG